MLITWTSSGHEQQQNSRAASIPLCSKSNARRHAAARLTSQLLGTESRAECLSESAFAARLMIRFCRRWVRRPTHFTQWRSRGDRQTQNVRIRAGMAHDSAKPACIQSWRCCFPAPPRHARGWGDHIASGGVSALVARHLGRGGEGGGGVSALVARLPLPRRRGRRGRVGLSGQAPWPRRRGRRRRRPRRPGRPPPRAAPFRRGGRGGRRG